MTTTTKRRIFVCTRTTFFNEDLLCALAGVAGEDNVLMSEPMREHTTFKIGGPADVFVTPDTEQGLVATFDTCYRCDLPLTIVGNGSDLLVGDKGIRGVVVALSKGLSDITVDGTHVTAAAGALLSDVAAAAAEAGLTGMEPISGIPGSVGGACYMNAGAYGVCMADVLESVKKNASTNPLASSTTAPAAAAISLSSMSMSSTWAIARAALPTTASSCFRPPSISLRATPR